MSKKFKGCSNVLENVGTKCFKEDCVILFGMKKVAFVIPGFKHSPDRKIYKNVIAEFNKKGVKTVPVKITWNFKTLTDWVKEFLQVYEKNKGNENILFGFSYGAMIAFIASTKIKPDN